MSTLSLISSLHKTVTALSVAERNQLVLELTNRLIARPAAASSKFTPSAPPPLPHLYHPAHAFPLAAILTKPSVTLATVITAAPHKS